MTSTSTRVVWTNFRVGKPSEERDSRTREISGSFDVEWDRTSLSGQPFRENGKG